MSDLNGVVLSFTGIISGLTIFSFLWKERRTAALGIGGSITGGGVVILLVDYAVISLATAWIIMGLILLSLAGFFYVVVDEGPGMIPFLAILFIGIFVLPLIQIYVLYFPTAVIFGYSAICISIMASYRKSGTVLTSNLARMNRYSRTLITPFSKVEQVVRKEIAGAHVREVLFSTYATFELILLLAVPFLITKIVGGTVVFEVLCLFLMWVVISSNWKISSVST